MKSSRSKTSGQSLVGVLVSIAVSSVMLMTFVDMGQLLNKSATHFQKSTNRTFFEMQIAGALGQQSLCSCNFLGRQVAVGGSLSVSSLTTQASACPAPATATRDLFDASRGAKGFPLASGLFARSITVQNVSRLAGNEYVGELVINYDSNQDAEVKLKPKSFFFYFNRDTANPASTETNPIISSCTVNSAPRVPAAAPEIPSGVHTGYCTERGSYQSGIGATASMSLSDNSETRGVAIPSSVRAPAYLVGVMNRYNQVIQRCACPTGYELHRALYIVTGTSDFKGIRTTTMFDTSFICMKQ